MMTMQAIGERATGEQATGEQATGAILEFDGSHSNQMNGKWSIRCR